MRYLLFLTCFILSSLSYGENCIQQNRLFPLDVNGDGTVTPLDSLLIRNYLNGDGIRQDCADGKVSYSLDVDGNGGVTSADALRVVNCSNDAGCPKSFPPSCDRWDSATGLCQTESESFTSCPTCSSPGPGTSGTTVTTGSYGTPGSSGSPPGTGGGGGGSGGGGTGTGGSGSGGGGSGSGGGTGGSAGSGGSGGSNCNLMTPLLSATAQSKREILLTGWSLIPNSQVIVERRELQTNNTSFQQIAIFPNTSNNSSYVVKGNVANRTYAFRVRLGMGSCYSAYSNEAFATARN